MITCFNTFYNFTNNFVVLNSWKKWEVEGSSAQETKETTFPFQYNTKNHRNVGKIAGILAFQNIFWEVSYFQQRTSFSSALCHQCCGLHIAVGLFQWRAYDWRLIRNGKNFPNFLIHSQHFSECSTHSGLQYLANPCLWQALCTSIRLSITVRWFVLTRPSPA